ncbi:MAG: ATPase, T2SS/T4P/T4SS family, partial [Patescibacteria group bacterium]
MEKSNVEIRKAQERAKNLGVGFINLTGRNISPNILREITEEAATFYQIIPIQKQGDVLRVGMLNPDDQMAKEALRFISQNHRFTPEILLITATDFKSVLKQYRNLKEEIDTALSELEKELASKEGIIREEGEGKAESVLDRVMAEAPITKIVAVILRHADEGRASDIHVEPGEEQLKIRFRVDGVMYTSLILPRAIQAAVVSRIKILASLKIDESRVPQ